MSILKRIKSAFNRFLARLEAANRESFGSKPLDCCTMDKRSPDKKSA